jgi:hypothetical protein
VVSPNVTAPFNEKSFENARAVVELLDTTVPLIATTPVPKA